MTFKDKENDKFESFFRNNKAVMLEIDTETKQITDVNHAAIKFYGYTKEEFMRKTVNDLNILPEEEVNKKMSEAVKNKSNFFEFKHKIADGTIKDVEVYASPFSYNDKTFMYATVLDITERKKAERKLKEQNEEIISLNEEYIASNEELTEKNKEFEALYEEYKSQNESLKIAKEKAEENQKRFKELTDLLPQVIYECDTEGKLLFVNKKSYEYFRYSEKDFKKGINITQMLIPEDTEKAKNNIKKIISGKKSRGHEYTALRKDGTKFPVIIYSNPILKNGKTAGLRGVIVDITNIKKAEEELKIQNKKLKLITEIEKTGTFDWDLKTNTVIWNDEMFSIHGIPKQIPMPYENWENTLHPDDKEQVVTTLSKVITDKTTKYAEFRIVRPGGEIRNVRASATIITDEKNEPVNVIGVTVDITEEYKTRAKIKEQLRNIELINANVPTVIWKTNIDNKGNFVNTYISETIDDFLALPKGTIKNNWNKFFDFVKPEYKKTLSESLEEAFKNPGKIISADYQIIKANGETAWFSSKGLTVFENKKLTCYGTTIDVTERKRTEEEFLKAKEKAEENQEKFKSIFDFSPQPISISNFSGELIEVNKKLCEISEHKKEEIINKNVVKAGFYSEEARKKFIEKLLETGKVENLEMTFYKKNGEPVETLTNATIITIKGKKHILSMVTDISKRKKAEAEIIKAKEKAEESDRLKTEFINNMSHEIRTPMNGIIGFSELLSDPDITPEKRNNYINIIQNSGKQLMRIIDDILEISKLGTKQVKPVKEKVCLNDLLLDLFSIFDIKAKENKTPLYLKKSLPDKESTIYTDSSKLTKILSNLLENSLKFTNDGFIEFGYYLKNDKIELYVKDTGIGIKQEKQNIIFERFSQEDKNISKQKGGLGLGLSIAKENTELLGGNIYLKSEKGKGSTFFVEIPYEPAFISDKKENKKTKTILIAENEEINFIYLETLLEHFSKNIKILHAKNGKEAIEIFKNNNVDLVFMDLKMPVTDGYEAAKQIKKINPDIPVIAQTAYSTLEEKEKALKAGCDDFISKPINKNDFEKTAKKYGFYDI